MTQHIEPETVTGGNGKRGNEIRTVSGRYFSLTNPDPADVCLSDIAFSLSRTARFTGHIPGPHPLSVAQHSVAVYELANLKGHAGAYALLHDAHEAYMGDWSRPLGREINNRASDLTPGGLYQIDLTRAIKDDIQQAIHRAFNLPWPMSPATLERVKLADAASLVLERNKYMGASDDRWFDHEDRLQFGEPRAYSGTALWEPELACLLFLDIAGSVGLVLPKDMP